jgi:Tol biopolymer transport system component
VGFFTPTQLKTVDVESGSVAALASIVGSGGGTWSGSTIIYSANSGTGPLYRVATTGGTPEPATRLQSPTALVHRHPWFLPDGQHFLYFEVNTTRSQVFVGSLQGADAVPLVATDTGAVFAGSGHLLFVRQSALLAQPFDAASLALSGAAQPLAEQIAVNEIGRPAVSASASGSIAYRTGVDVARRQFVWFDRSGKEVSGVATPEISQANPEISPDGARLALQRNVSGNTDIWLLDVQRGIFNRVTNDAAIDALPIWSPDGRRLAFTSNRGVSASRDSMATPTGLQRGIGSLLVMSADGSGEPQLLVTSPEPKWANDWSRDGRQLVFRSLEQPGTHDVWVTAVEHPAPVKILDSPADERDAQLSPDGRWIAYQSNESSRDEIYIQRFPDRGGKERVSTAGGTQVRWRADGRELFYVTPANEIAAVSIQLPQVLFATRMASGGVGVPRQQYVVSSDGQRFLINALEAVELTAPIRLLLNWTGASRQENSR